MTSVSIFTRSLNLALAVVASIMPLGGPALAAPGDIHTVAGGWIGDSGPAVDAFMYSPSGVAVDLGGNIIFADTGNQRIRKVDPATGMITTIAGNGEGGFGGDGESALSARLHSPNSVLVNSAGDIYFSDQSNNRIRKIDRATGVISTVAGNGTAGYGGDGGPAVDALLNTPTAICTDTAGNIYVADSDNSRIRRIDNSGTIATVAGTGAAWYSGDGGSAISAQLNHPWGIAVDAAGNLYISDTDNRRIRKVDAATGIINTVAGNGTFGFSGDGGSALLANLGQPTGSFIDGAGKLYFADGSNNRIRMLDTTTGSITTVAGNNGSGLILDGLPATESNLNFPATVAGDVFGHLYIADRWHNRIRKVDAGTGIMTTVAGKGWSGFWGDNGPADAASLYYPRDSTVDAAGNLYIADTSNHRIRKVDAISGTITTVAGNGICEYGNIGDEGPSILASLCAPYSVTVDSLGNLFIADYLHYRVRKIDAGTGIITTIAGNGVEGYGGDAGPATEASMKSPYDVLVDAAGNVYIADTYNQRIRKVAADTGIISTIVGNGLKAFAGDDGPAVSACLNNPQGLALDNAGNLYIADTTNYRVRKVDAGTGIITTHAGNGTSQHAGDGGQASAASLQSPRAVAVDHIGNLYLSDGFSSRVRKVEADTGIIITVAGNGTSWYNGDGIPALSAGIPELNGIAVDTSGNIYIATAHLIRKVEAVLDTIPSLFSFIDQAGVDLNTQVASNVIPVTALGSPATILITGGEYELNASGTWTGADGSVQNGDTVRVRQISSPFHDTTTDTVLTIGGVFDTFSVTTKPDTTPEPFSFDSQLDVPRSTLATSNSATVTGITGSTLIIINGGEYEINASGVWDSTAGSVSNGDAVRVRHTSSPDYATTTGTVLTVGGVSGVFSVTTVAFDAVPDPFSFTDKTGQLLNTLITSNSITMAGITAPSPISIAGGEYEINASGSWTAAAGAVSNGDLVRVRQISSGSYSTTTGATLTIGGVSDMFSVTTMADLIPDPFSFIDQTNVPINTLVTSNTITITGITSSVTARVQGAGGAFQVNGGGSWYTSPRPVSNGTRIQVRLPSAPTHGTTVTTIFTAGSVSSAFSVTTLPVFDLSMTTSPGGQVISQPSGTTCYGTCSQQIPAGTVVTLTASPLEGAIFSGWTGDCAGADPVCTFTMDAAKSVTATFIPIPPDGFYSQADATVLAMAVQPDGKVLVGGAFTALDVLPRSRIGRLNADGTVDTTFDPGANNSIYSLAVQPDGKILVGGSFTTLGGAARIGIGRLHADGTLDATFNPGNVGIIFGLSVQSDGKILVAGSFPMLGGSPRSNIGRLNSDGTIDASFNPGANSTIRAMAIQPDGKIIVGGQFTTLGGSARNHIGRINADGTLDTTFDPGVNSLVYALAVQADGKIIVGGQFGILGGGMRYCIGRLNADGALDTTFNLELSGSNIFSLVIQLDGKILVGGTYTMLGGSARSNIGRLNADGTLDTAFNPGADNSVYSFAIQPDGKVLAGGAFTTLANRPRSHLGRLYADGHLDTDTFLNPWTNSPVRGLAVQADGKILIGAQGSYYTARLHADGTPDMTFNPQANGPVYTIASQPDGKILAGGSFTSLGGSGRSYLGRITTAGALDIAFNPPVNNTVNAIALQPDGKILIGGYFTNLGGGSGSYFGRLNADGTRDTTFNTSTIRVVHAIALQPDGKIIVGGVSILSRINADGTVDQAFSPAPDGTVYAIAVQKDGKILVGGNFTMLGGAWRSRIARLNADGSIDLTFNPAANYTVLTFAVQTDGKILVGGAFTSLGGYSRDHLGRLNADGSLDLVYNPGADNTVTSLALMADGSIILGGDFTKYNWFPRSYVGRLMNTTAAVQDLQVSNDGSTVMWHRSGTSPEVLRVEFERSADGTTWTPLGSGSRVSGGWQLTGLSQPRGQNLYVRAIGFAQGGYSSASGSLYESIKLVYLALPTHIVTPFSGSNGSISPGTPQTINENTAAQFTVIPAAGYQIGSIDGCGGALTGIIYTTAAITADCTVSVSFIDQPTAAKPASLWVRSATNLATNPVVWGPSTTPDVSYEVEEDATSAFTNSRSVYTGAALSTNVTVSAPGTYYYRVRAVAAGFQPSTWRVSVGSAVTLTVGKPVSLWVRTATNVATNPVVWGLSPMTGATYEVEEDTDVNFTSPKPVYSGGLDRTTVTVSASGTYYYRVRAVAAGYQPSAWVKSVGSVVALTAAKPISLWVRSATNVATNPAVWGASPTAEVLYEVEEDTTTAFTNPRPVYSGTAPSTNVTVSASGTYYYRVRAVASGYQPSAWVKSVGSIVTLTAAKPASLWVRSWTNVTTNPVVWGQSSTPGVTYEVEEDTDVNFTNPRPVYSGAPDRTNVTVSASGTYYYRVRAVAEDHQPSAWRVSIGSVVALP